MTRNALLAALIAMALAPGVSRAATLAAHGLASTVDSAGDPGDDFKGVSSLSEITSLEPAWAKDRDDSTFASEFALADPSPAARTEGWALVPEPAAWAILLVGLSGLGACLRVRRGLAPAPAHAR
jgi:hypothetical protein